MRIEIRNGDEYLIDAPVEVNDCTAERNFHTCDTHFDGQHLATTRTFEDGSACIVERWPIDPAPEQPAQPASRFLTPDEVRVAQAAHVLAAIERINAELAAGVRVFVVNAPLFEEIERELESAGWVVLNDGPANGRTSFVVRERKEGE